jgi:hypothetical protein
MDGDDYMDCKCVENILLSYGLSKGENSEGTHFTFSKGKFHKIIFERLRLLQKGGTGGYLYAEVLDDYKSRCSKNGHICLSKISNETEFKDMLERVIAHFDATY